MSDSKTSPEKQAPPEIIARFLWRVVNEPRQGYFSLAESMVAVLVEAGYRIVPVEPTEAMVDDAYSADALIGHNADIHYFYKIWRAMVGAAS